MVMERSSYERPYHAAASREFILPEISRDRDQTRHYDRSAEATTWLRK